MAVVYAAERVSAITCPPSADLSPCFCTEFFSPGQASLYCVSQNLDDAKMGQILDAYLAAGASVSPLEVMYLDRNQLTRVPTQISLFPNVFYVNLDYNNIRQVASGSFNFRPQIPPIRLFLGYNQLTSIEAGAFQGLLNKFFLICYLVKLEIYRNLWKGFLRLSLHE